MPRVLPLLPNLVSRAGRYTDSYPIPGMWEAFLPPMPWRPGKGFTPHQRPRDTVGPLSPHSIPAPPRRSGFGTPISFGLSRLPALPDLDRWPGGFLRGVRLGCLDMARITSKPRPSFGAASEEGSGPREAPSGQPHA